MDFEFIESFYQLNDGRQILCPIGKHEPINLDDLSKYENDELNKIRNWDFENGVVSLPKKSMPFFSPNF